MTVRIENWSVVNNSNPYTPPELIRPKMNGDVYGHPLFPDGQNVTTSRIETVNGRVVTTYSRDYLLGAPNPSYVEWCEEKGQHVPTWDEPIKVKDA